MVLPKIRLKPTPYAANTSAWTASDVVYGESPNQIDGRIARMAAVTAIGKRAPPTCLVLAIDYRPSNPRGRMRIVSAAAPSRMMVVMYCPM